MEAIVRKVAAAVLSGDGQRLLVVRKRGRDVFILPGGQPMPGESAEQTLRREIREELAVGVSRLRPLMSVADRAAFEDVPLVMEVFSAALDGAPHPSAEIEELAWVGPAHVGSGLRLATGITDHVLPRLFGVAPAVRDNPQPVAVLFSGGRDSTAVALGFREAGHTLHLLSFRSALGVDDGLQAVRLAELARAWPAGSFVAHQLPVAGLIREICFRDLAQDVLADGCQLILLGESIAMLIRAVEICRREGIRSLAMGATGYQAHFPEQQPATLRSFAVLCGEYGVRFLTPGAQWRSELEVKERLSIAGLSTKSLESSSLLADLDDHPPEAAVGQYVARKFVLARALVAAGGTSPST